ncbi:hypothetical protein MTP04_23160 [Lysinibacillus sp. PLM2]|nr:hypothetical protein MTP04_23160 [Lysinibacillus sp. PLM2]
MLEKKTEKQSLFNWLCRIGTPLNSAFLITDPSQPNEPIVYANSAFTKITGYSEDEVIGKSKSLLFGENTQIETIKEIENNKKNDTSSSVKILNYKKDGTTFWNDYFEHTLKDENGNHFYNISIFSDSIEQQSQYIDTISGISNYLYFIDKFNKMTKSYKKTGFLLLMQPGEYINIVDAFGKTQLGYLLKELNRRVNSIYSNVPCIISRATEGSLIVAVFCEENEIDHYLEMLMQTVKEPILVNDIDLYISLKIGAVSFEFYNDNIDEFVRFADIALTQSKKQAGNSIALYQEQFGYEIQQKIKIQNELVQAIRKKEISVHLQPKVDISNGKIVSFEALARWKHAKLGYVPPDVFIEAAETIGKIEELDFLVIEQVLAWLAERKKGNLKLYQISVNISPSHFYTPNFIENLLNIVNRYEIETKYIKIELTENIGLVDLERAKQIINELSIHGFECSVDDFGIGFSSLSYLHQLPVTELKIDRSFINNLQDSGGSAIVKTIIQLASNMNLLSVAEGIETEEQLEIIREMSCQIAQGYYFYKPMSLEEADAIIQKEHSEQRN